MFIPYFLNKDGTISVAATKTYFQYPIILKLTQNSISYYGVAFEKLSEENWNHSYKNFEILNLEDNEKLCKIYTETFLGYTRFCDLERELKRILLSIENQNFIPKYKRNTLSSFPYL